MQAIILTAGYGRRMQPLSAGCHKALLPIAGTTILGRIVDSLLAVGVSDIMIVTGYRADDVRAFLQERYPHVAFSFVHNARYADTNNIVSLSLALDRMKYDLDVLLIECDLLFDTDVLRRLVRAPGGNVALVDHFRAGMDGTVVAVEDGVITHVYPPHLQGSDFTYGDKFKTLNIYRFDREFCRATLQPLLSCYANFIDGNCYYELVLGMLVNMQRQRIAAEVVDGSYWAEVDDPNDLAVARYHFEPEQRASVLDRACGGHWNFELLDFAFMRNAYFPTDAMMAAFRQALPALLRSYGSAQVVLNEKLSYFLTLRARPSAGAPRRVAGVSVAVRAAGGGSRPRAVADVWRIRTGLSVRLHVHRCPRVRPRAPGARRPPGRRCGLRQPEQPDGHHDSDRLGASLRGVASEAAGVR